MLLIGNRAAFVFRCFFVSLTLLTGSALAQSSNRVALTGSSTVAPLMLEIGKRFEAKHPGVRVDVQMGGSSRGIGDARSGSADIGMVSRSAKPEESDLSFSPIARDGIAIVLHHSNPVKVLSRGQIVAIYTGAIQNWSQVGGKPMPITVVNKAEGRSTLELFLQYFNLKNSDIKAKVVIGDNPQGIKTVAGNPGAIGYVSIGAAEVEAELGVPIKLLPMEGVPAATEQVLNGKYPLSRVLNLVTKPSPSGLSKQLIDFAQSPVVDDLIHELSFVPLKR